MKNKQTNIKESIFTYAVRSVCTSVISLMMSLDTAGEDVLLLTSAWTDDFSAKFMWLK